MRIRELRQARGLTQLQLGMAVGVSKPAVCRWENGVAMPRAELLPVLARALGCSIDELFGADDRADGAMQAPAS